MRAYLELPHLSIVAKGDVLLEEQSISNNKIKGYA